MSMLNTLGTIVVGGGVTLTATPALADSYLVRNVNNLDIVGSCSPGMPIWGGPGPSYPSVHECTSLRAAITAANGHGGSDEVLLEPGFYEVSIAGVEDVNAKGDFDITVGDLVVMGMGPSENRTEEGNGGALGNVGGSVEIRASSRAHSRFELDQTTLGFGGSIHSDGGTLDIQDTVVSSGESTFSGGCIHLHDGAVLNMSQSSLDECHQVATHPTLSDPANSIKGGGAIALSHDMGLGGPSAAPAEAYLTNVAIGSNNAGGYGGGIYVQDGVGVVELDYVTLSKNNASALSYGTNQISFECSGSGTGCTASNSVIDKGCANVLAVSGTANLEEGPLYSWKTGATCTGFSIFGSINGLGWAGTGVGNETMGEDIDAASDAWEAGPTATTGQVDQTGLTRNGPTDLGAREKSP